MATKINTTYYGAENTWTSLNIGGYTYNNFQYTPKTLQTYMFTDNTFDKTLDASACPWGIPECSVTSMRRVIYGKTSGRLDIRDSKNERKNTPLLLAHGSSGFYSSSFTDSNDTMRANAKRRVYGNITEGTSPNVLKSSNTCDRGNTVVDNSTLIGSNVYTSFDYQAAHIVPLSIAAHGKNESSSEYDYSYTFNYLANADENVLKNLEITSFRYSFYVNGTSADVPSFVGNCLTSPDILTKEAYYDDTVTEIFNYFRAMSNNTIGGRGFRDTSNISGLYSYSNFGTKSSTFSTSSAFTPFTTASAKRQVFDDVSYHWETRFVVRVNGVNMYYRNDDPLPASGSASTYQALIIDSYDDSLTYGQAIQRAILHELAFIGLAIYTDTTKLTIPPATGDETIYIPVFDLEHMMTTGEFKNGTAGAALPNAQWGDIFANTMPEYDPDYVPPEPQPDEGDYGYLNNKPITNRVYSSNNRVYALTAVQYSQFINDVNSLYLDDPNTGFDRFQLDFKGTNPSDYIVGTYGYTFLPAGLIPNQQPEQIQIGAVTLPNAEGYRIAPSYIYNYRSLGEIDLTGAGDFKPFGDFRDFEPYTHIELYIPLCGNIELDPASVVGHTIQIEIIFDIMTGNATACVYRDNQTLIATVAGQLAASLPLTSGRMGDYQNAVKSAENALKQNELKTTTAAATVAMGVGAALLAPETGGLSLAAYGAALTGGASLMSLSNQKNQIEYEIKHKQPSISVCSSANGAVAQNISSMYAVCYVKQCKMLSTYNAATYAHTIGYATVKNTTIGAETTDDSNSLIVCSTADLSGIPATAAEINTIQSLLTGGVYV